jgi:hypothetical protein
LHYKASCNSSCSLQRELQSLHYISICNPLELQSASASCSRSRCTTYPAATRVAVCNASRSRCTTYPAATRVAVCNSSCSRCTTYPASAYSCISGGRSHTATLELQISYVVQRLQLALQTATRVADIWRTLTHSYTCPHTPIYVPAYYYTCGLILLYVSSYSCPFQRGPLSRGVRARAASSRCDCISSVSIQQAVVASSSCKQ